MSPALLDTVRPKRSRGVKERASVVREGHA